MYQIYVGCDWHLYSNKYDAHHPYRTARSIGRLADNYGYMIDETDIFIFLGDLCDLQVCDMKKLNQVSNIIHNIKGYKIMCKGNHDLFDDDVYLELGFDEVCDIATAYGLVFSHVPVRVMPNEINIHAHLHHEKVSSLGYQHINAYSANFQKEDQPISVDTLLKEAPMQDVEYNNKWEKEVTEQFKQYTAIRDDVLHSKIIDISDKIPLYPVDEASAEMNEVLFPDTDSTKYWEADDNTYQDELDAAEYSDARKPHKVRGKNDVFAESVINYHKVNGTLNTVYTVPNNHSLIEITQFATDILDGIIQISPEALDRAELVNIKNAEMLINHLKEHRTLWNNWYSKSFGSILQIDLISGFSNTTIPMESIASILPYTLTDDQFGDYIRLRIQELDDIQSLLNEALLSNLNELAIQSNISKSISSTTDKKRLVKILKTEIDRKRSEVITKNRDGSYVFDYSIIQRGSVYISKSAYNEISDITNPSRFIGRLSYYDYIIISHGDYDKDGRWIIDPITIDGKSYTDIEKALDALHPESNRILAMSCNREGKKLNELKYQNVTYADTKVMYESALANDNAGLSSSELLSIWKSQIKKDLKQISQLYSLILKKLNKVYMLTPIDEITLLTIKKSEFKLVSKSIKDADDAISFFEQAFVKLCKYYIDTLQNAKALIRISQSKEYDQNKGYRAIAYDKNLRPIELKSTLHENISFTNSFPITALDELLQEIVDYDDINDPLHEGALMYDIFDNSNGNKYTLTSKDCIELLSSTNIFTESASGVVVDLSPLIGKNTDKMTILSKDIFDNFLRIAPEALDKEKIKTARNAQDLIDMFNEMVMKAINTAYKQDGHLSDLDSYTAGLHILAMIYAHNNGVITKKTLKKVSPDLIPLDLKDSEFDSYIREVVDQLTKIEEYYINMVEYALTFIGFGYADSVNALRNLDGPKAIKLVKKYVDKNEAEFVKTYSDGTIQYDFRHIHLNHVYIAPNLATDTGYVNRIKPSRYIERTKRFDYCIFAHADSYIKNGKQMWTIPGGITIDGKQFVNMEDIVKYLNPRKHRILIMSCNPGHIEPNGEVFNNNVEYAGNDVILESSDIHQLNVHTLLKKWMDYTKHGIKRLNKIEEQILTIIDELELVVAPDAVQLMYGFKLDREEDITPKELRHRFADSIETSISTYMEFLLSSRIIARALMDKLNGTLITECTKGYGWAYSYNGSISTLPESTHTQLYPAIYRYPDKDTMFEDMALAELIPEVSTTINPLIKNEQISDCRFDYVDYAEQSSSDDKYYPTYHNIPESDWPNETALFIQTPHRNISTVESSLTESSVVRTQILGENLTLDSYRSDDIALQINGTKYKIKAKDILDDYINVSPEDIADCREEEIRSIDDLSDRLYKVLQSYGKHYEESCAGAKSLYNLMMIATDSNDPFSKPENKKLFRMMVEYFLPKGITDKQFNDLVHTRMRELKDIEYYLIKLLETNIALFGLEVTEVNALAMSSDRKKVIKDIKCRVDEQADKITDHRSSCTVYDFNQLYAGINCRVYIGNQLIHDAEQRGISTTPSRFLIRARKYDHIIATHAIANAKYDYEIQPIVMDNGTKVTTVNALLKELSLQNAKNVLLLICNPNAIDLDPIIDRYRMNVDYINPDSDGEGIIAIYESSANTALKYMSIMDELDSWNTRLKTTRKSIDHMECDLYDYMERYGYLTAPEKIYFAKLNSNTSHPIQVKDKTSIKYENYIKLRGYGVHLAFTYLKTLLYVTKLFIKYALHRYDRLVTEHASGYQAIMRNQLQMFDQEDQIATFSMQNKSYITESCIGPEDYLYQSMTELKEDIELYRWANTDNMMIQESSVKEYNRTDDNKPIRDRKESKEYAEKYGIRPIGQEESDEKSSEEIERMKKAKQLQHARAIKKRKKIVNKVKQHLPFVKNEDVTAVDNSDIMELDIEHSPLYGDKKNFFYNYNMPKEVNDPAERLDESFHADTFLIEPKTFFGDIKLYHISRSKLTKIIPGSINVGNRLQVKPRMSSWWTPYYKRQAAWMLMVELKSKYGVDKATKWNNFSWTTVYDQEMQRNAPQVVIRKKFYEDHKREIDNFKVYVHEKIFKGNELGLGVEYSTKEYTCDEPITPDKVFILQLDDFRDYITIADDAEFKQLTARFAEAKKNHKHLSDILDVDKPWYYYDYETAKQKKLKQDHIISETSHKSIIDSGHKQHGHIDLDDLTKIEITEKWRKEHVVQYPWLKHIASSDDEIDASAWLDNDKLVAIISVDRIPSKRNKIWIHNIHIDDKYRGYGLSKQLLDYATRNYKANALAVKIDNKLAQKVYLDYGFSFGSGKDDTMGNSKIMYLNESSIQESYQFELLDKNVHFYDKIDEAASYQAKGKLYPVYVMLVHSGTTVSNLIKTISHSEYSHASISFDSSLDHMYSFARKDPKNPFLGGFRYESIGKGFYDKKKIPYALYVVPCTEDQVKRMKKRLDYFVKNNSKFSFDFAGLVKNYIGYADEPEYRWFCSRFVADILNAGSPEEFKYIDEPSLMDPDDFRKTNFARFVISGDNMMEYDRKLVDKLTKKILIEEKHRKQTGYTLAEDVIDPTIPYEDDILVYQLLTMDESVVDDVLNYLQSFKIKFDQDGNVIIHQREYKELSQHFNKSKRMLRHYRKTGATESIKNELCKLYYMINIIETYYLKPTTDEKYKERQKQMMDLRALMINVFRQNLNEVTAKEPNFNFQSYYNASDYGKDLKIPKTVIAATGKALITMLS